MTKFTPPINFLYKSEVLTNRETVIDTTIDNQKCYLMQREALVEYFIDKDKKKASDYRIYFKSHSIINKNDYAILYYQYDYFVSNRDSTKVYKTRLIDIYESIGSHYYRKASYFIQPRYMTNHPMDYNNKGLYTVIVRKSEPLSDIEKLNSLEKLPNEPYKKFCKKIEKVPDEGIKIYEEAKRFINEPLPSFGELEKFWSKK